jgi:hypothetical protein
MGIQWSTASEDVYISFLFTEFLDLEFLTLWPRLSCDAPRDWPSAFLIRLSSEQAVRTKKEKSVCTERGNVFVSSVCSSCVGLPSRDTGRNRTRGKGRCLLRETGLRGILTVRSQFGCRKGKETGLGGLWMGWGWCFCVLVPKAGRVDFALFLISTAC